MELEVLKKRIFSLVADNKLDVQDAFSILDEISDQNPAEPLALVSMAIRFPEADTTDQLWEHLMQRRNLVESFPKERFDLIMQSKPELRQQFEKKRADLASDPRSYAAWLRKIEQFDPEAFGLTAHEAQFMGPAERIFLQVALEALTRAGYSSAALHESQTGVFVAHTPYPPFDYLKLFDEMDERAFVSNIPANLGYHLAYTLNLRGPVLTVNTSCSSSLAALHVAKNALRVGDCEIAVVGGVNLMLFPFWEEAPDYVVRSPHYRCASYDAEANGIIGGEGIAVVVLKRLSDALRDHNYIHAVIKGSGMSSDGASNGLQAPNPDAQSQAIRSALADAHIQAEQIGYVEGHGTGTALGDLIEVEGLTRAFRQDTAATGFCQLGSIKSNIGHLGDAAGLAGLIKAVLCLEHRVIPGLASFKQENPKIGFAKTPFRVSADTIPWEDSGSGRRYAGVSSIGISGTNVHVVLEEFVPASTDESGHTSFPLLLSAPTRWALWEFVQLLAPAIENNQHWSMRDIAHTLNARGEHGPARVGIFAASTKELAEKLDRLLQVRSFERAPETFFTQGIFLADEASTQAYSLAQFERYTAPIEAESRVLMKNFLAGENIAAQWDAFFAGGYLLPLPTVPFKTRPIWPTSEAIPQHDVSDLFFEMRWQESPMSADGAKRFPAVKEQSLWLLFTRQEDAILPLVKERLIADGAQVIRVLLSTRFAKVGEDTYEVMPQRPEDFLRLFEEIGNDALTDLAGVIHGFSLKPAVSAIDTLEEIESSQNEGVFSLFGLSKAILAQNLTHPLQFVVVSSLAEQVVAGDMCVPTRVTAFGLAKVFSQELPTIHSLAIDHDLVGSPEAIAAQIFAEITSDPGARKDLVAYRQGKRLVKVVGRQADSMQRTLPIREGGTYVIAGGTGYLGMQVGLFLSQRARVNIILLARNPLPERSQWDALQMDASPQNADLRQKIAAMQKMEERGSRVAMLQCDVTDPAMVARVFAHIRREYGAIHGAFMLVKQLYHLWLHEITFEQYQNGIYNRVKGTWLVEREVYSPELDFFILFSSISSLMGTKSASECCAVNQFLDAMGGYLQQQGVPAHVLNLTLILDDKSDFGSKTPIPPISFADFHSALDRFFRNGPAWSLVSRFDMEEVRFLKPVLKIPFEAEFWQEVEMVAAGAPTSSNVELHVQEQVLDAEAIRLRLEEIWKKVLGIDSVHDRSNFFSCGGTSLSALRFVQLFRRGFATVPFEVTDLYSMPEFQAQVAYCEQALCPEQTDALADLFDALELGNVSTEDAITLFEKSLVAHGKRGAF
ncbi:MAG TPA: beta-ketoacyl synthase N-terminal-like domain-containing protein [Ktedonobacteraceae bacterium]|nr:beta-ketoacyl synthase N-terminal-like domain-containing protein [Ktedonobacteraceae bacterium]